MAAPSTTDPEIDAFVQGLRNVLMQVPARNRSGFFRHVEDMLEVWGRMLERDDVRNEPHLELLPPCVDGLAALRNSEPRCSP